MRMFNYFAYRYAGGIVSAAVDGMKVAGRLIDRLDSSPK